MNASESDGNQMLKAYSPSSDDNTDPCERLVSFLEWASAQRNTTDITEQLSAVFEKGSLYRGFVSLDGLSLVEQVLYLFQKFNEYNERLIVIDQDLSVGRSSHSECLTALAEFLFMHLLQAQYQSPFGNAILVELQSVHVMANVLHEDIVIVLHREAGGKVFTATLSTASKEQFIQAFVACVLPFLPPLLSDASAAQEAKQDGNDDPTEAENDILSLANIAWLVRVNGNFDSDVDQDLLDEHVLHLTQELRNLRQKECQHRIVSLRTNLLSIRHALVGAVEASENPLISTEDYLHEATLTARTTTAAAAAVESMSRHKKSISSSDRVAEPAAHHEGRRRSEEKSAHEREVPKEEREEEKGEEQSHHDGAVESLLLGSGEEFHLDDVAAHHKDTQARSFLREEEKSNGEDEVGNESLSASPPATAPLADDLLVDEAEQQFAHVMSTLDRYGANITTHTYTEDDDEGELPAEAEAVESQHDNVGQVAVSSPTEFPEELELGEEFAQQSQDHSFPSPPKDFSPSGNHQNLPQNDFSDPIDEGEEVEQVEISRTLFPVEDADISRNESAQGQVLVVPASPETSSVHDRHNDQTEGYSSLLPPPAVSVESPHVVIHPSDKSNHASQHAEETPPCEKHHTAAVAEPLSSSMVANLMSSVGDESQSVDFSHYLHRAYELIKEHAVHDALEQEEGDLEESDESDGNELHNSDQDASMIAPQQEEENVVDEIANSTHYDHHMDDGNNVKSRLTSPVVLRDQLPLPQHSPLAPTSSTSSSTVAPTALSHPVTAAEKLASPFSSPQRVPTAVEAESVLGNDPIEEDVDDLVPVPFSHRSVSPTLAPRPESPLAPAAAASTATTVATGLRPLTASMVDALPSSGATALENTAAIEDYSAAAYQMFKNRAFADLYDNAASCEFENNNNESFAEEDDIGGGGEKSLINREEEDDDESQDFDPEGVAAEEDDQGLADNAPAAVDHHHRQEINSDSEKAVRKCSVEDLLLGTAPAIEIQPPAAVASAAGKGTEDARKPPVAVTVAPPVPTQVKRENALKEHPPLAFPVLTSHQVAALSAKLLNLRTQVEQEAEIVKAKKNLYRVEMGKRVLALLFAEEAEPGDDQTNYQKPSAEAIAHGATNQTPEPPIRNVSVRSHGISFTAAPSAAPVAEKPVLSSHFRTHQSSHDVVSDGGPSSSPQGRAPLRTDQEKNIDSGKGRDRAGSAGASRLPRPAPSDVNSFDPSTPSEKSPYRQGYAAQHEALPPPPQSVLQSSPHKLSSPAHSFHVDFAPSAAHAPAPPPRLRLNQVAARGNTAAAASASSGDAQDPTPRSARTDQSSLPPPSSARAQSAGRAGRKLSNYAQIKNAINSVCMAGSHFDAKRIEVFEILDHFRFGKQMSAASEEQFVNDFSFLESAKGAVAHFMIMFFQSKTLSFKGIYAADPTSGSFLRVFGKGPKEFADGSIPVQQFLKFETPSKSFKQIHVKNFSHNVDAFILDAVAFKARS